jgi:hypothetical protein
MDKDQIIQKGFATKFKIKTMQQLLKLKLFLYLHSKSKEII